MMKQGGFWILLSTITLLLSGCSATKFIPENEYMLDNLSVRSVDKAVKANTLSGYVRQHPNSKWFSLLKIPMGPYALSGLDSTRRINRFLQRVGEAPVIYDSLQAGRTQTDIQYAVANMGYLRSNVVIDKKIKGKKISLTYTIEPGPRYTVRNIERQIDDTVLAPMLEQDTLASLLRPGMPFDINKLEAERTRIYSLLQNRGYYKFNKEYIHYDADTCIGNHQVDIRLKLSRPQENTDGRRQNHRPYRIRKVDIFDDGYLQATYDPDLRDSLLLPDNKIYFRDRLHLRPRVLQNNLFVVRGTLFSERDVQNTYNHLGRLQAVMSSQVKMSEVAPDSNLLDCDIHLNYNKPHSFSMEPEGTNSAGDLGAAVSFSYQNRNIFRGSELFNIKLRGAYEAITGLEGYSDQNYVEFSAEMGLTFPDFKFPFISHARRRSLMGTSEFSIMYDSQNRPEFHRRVLTGALRYRWKHLNSKLSHRVDLLDLNYVFMPWISDTFKNDYLDDNDNRNAILRYNYENLFIMKLGYSLTYNSQGTNSLMSSYGNNATVLRMNIESAGNLLYGGSRLFNATTNNENQYTLFNIAYAQYVKGDFEYAQSTRIDDRNSVAWHARLGIAYPYGNSTILPYEKRYFSGGANSVRGWSVRELGPGTYTGTDGRIDFINQTGDIRLDLSVEYRTFLFWKIHGAAFIDAGNIWTIRSYDEQPGGQFHFHSFWRQIAAAYGLGLRLNFDFFIIRLDGGMKAINPAFKDKKGHYPIIHPKFRRDFTFHFAVGLPF